MPTVPDDEEFVSPDGGTAVIRPCVRTDRDGRQCVSHKMPIGHKRADLAQCRCYRRRSHLPKRCWATSDRGSVSLETRFTLFRANDCSQTIVGSSTSATTRITSLTTTNPLTQTTVAVLTTSTSPQVGPVGQPATTPAVAGGETPYTYTTTDANGNQVVMQGVFTPTSPQTVLPVPTTTGTVLGYSQWLSIIGTYTAPPNAAYRTSTSLATGWYYFAATTLTGLIGGAWLII